MVLTHLELRRFKRFRYLSLDLRPGLNIIRGPNESGKSTLRQALMTAFFANPTGASESIKNFTSWGESEPCELILEYMNQQGQPCRLRKDFAARKMFLQCQDDLYKIPKTIQQKVVDELGVTSEELFGLCASLDVRSLAQLGNAVNRRQLGKMLAGLISGTATGPDALQALKRLDEALKELGKGLRGSPTKIPGPMKAVKDKILTLSAQRTQMLQDLRTRQERQQRCHTLKQETALLQQRDLDLSHLLEANRKFLETKKRYDELTAQDAQYEQIQRARDQQQQELTSLEQRLANDPLSQFTPADIREMQNDLSVANQHQPLSPPPAADAGLPVMVGLAVVFAGVGLLLMGMNGWLGTVMLLGGMGFGFGAWRKLRVLKVRQKVYREICRQHQSEKEQIQVRLNAWTIKAPGLSVDVILAAWPEFQKAMAIRETVARQLKNQPLLDENQWKEARREMRLLHDFMNDPEFRAKQLAPEALVRIQREHETARGDFAARNEEWQRLQAIVEYDAASPEALAALDEELEECQERIVHLEMKEKIIGLTFDFLDRARRATLHPARQVLEQRAGELLARFSSGRYRNIAVDDEDLSSKIWIEDTARWEDPSVLSQGAFDQLYLSLRLALAELFSAGKRPPLLLDEPFAALDPKRQAATLGYLCEAAKDQQIIIFTCRSDYDQGADHLVELDPASAVQTGIGA